MASDARLTNVHRQDRTVKLTAEALALLNKQVSAVCTILSCILLIAYSTQLLVPRLGCGRGWKTVMTLRRTVTAQLMHRRAASREPNRVSGH